MQVEVKQLPAAALETGFELQFDRDTFKDTDFQSNMHLADDCSIAQSLDNTYNHWHVQSSGSRVFSSRC